jgi:F-type H+-transporting ATPase subunit epsilon
MQIEILTPDKKLFEGEIISAKFAGEVGGFQVLNNHAAIISSLAKGDLVLKTNDGTQTFALKSGVVEVLNNKIIVLAEV